MKLFLSLIAFLAMHQAIGQSKINRVVVILADDHAMKATGAYGNNFVMTPNIDKLSRSSITFTNAYCNSPICSASRQSLLTGKYPHSTGVNLLFTPFPDAGNITIAEHLRERNYRTAIIGKSHFNNWVWGELYPEGLPDHGFDKIVDSNDYRRFFQSHGAPTASAQRGTYNYEETQQSVAEKMNARVLPHPVNDIHSEGTFFANEAIQFLEDNASRPFLLWLAFKEPHQPFYFPVEYEGMYDPNQIVLPKGVDGDDRWVPEIYKDLTDAEKKGIIAAYYTSTSYMDKNVGLVMQAIKRLGIEEHTLVIYLSDNGYQLYDHKRFEKHTLWEESVRQPTIFKIPGKRSRVIDEIVEYVDVVPTVLDLLGEDPIEESQGTSFLPILESLEATHKGYAFATYLEDNMVMVRNDRWKYIFSTGSRDLGIGYQTGNGPSGIAHRLYNLQTDPGETTNLAIWSTYDDVFRKMQHQMLNHFMLTHPEAPKCPPELSTEGKLVWFSEPRDIGADQSLEANPVRVFKPNSRQP